MPKVSVVASYAGDPRLGIELNGMNSGNAFERWNK